MKTDLSGGNHPRNCARPELSRIDNAQTLNLFHQILWQALRIEGGWLPGLVPWNWKRQIGGFIWRDAIYAQALRERLAEIRFPLKRFEKNRWLRSVLCEVAHAPDDASWLAGAFLELKSRLLKEVRQHAQATLPVADAPTVDVLHQLSDELQKQVGWAQSALKSRQLTEIQNKRMAEWRRYLGTHLRVLFQEQPQPDSVVPAPPCRKPFQPFAQAARGEDVLLGDHRELVVILDHPTVNKTVITEFRNYCQEMMAAETLGSTIYEVDETTDMPWEFYYDSARHLYDEVRHSDLGVDRLGDFGISLKDVPQTNFHYGQRMKLSPTERYGVLTMVIEADSFPDMHARQKQHQERGDFKSAEYVSYDIVDETLHVKFGYKWLPVLLEKAGETRSLEEFTQHCHQRWQQLAPDYSDMAAVARGAKEVASPSARDA